MARGNGNNPGTSGARGPGTTVTARSCARSSRSRSKRRWSVPSSSTRCRSSCRGRSPTCETAEAGSPADPLRDVGHRLRPDRPHAKCSKVVGDVMGRFHPHGDLAIYDALARMAQDFSLRIRSSTDTGTLVLRGPTPAPQRCATPSAGSRRSRLPCSTASTRGRSISSPITTATKFNRSSCLPASRTCWSTGLKASPSAWRPTSRPQPWRGHRRNTAPPGTPEATPDELMHYVKAPTSDWSTHSRPGRPDRCLPNRTRLSEAARGGGDHRIALWR